MRQTFFRRYLWNYLQLWLHVTTGNDIHWRPNRRSTEATWSIVDPEKTNSIKKEKITLGCFNKFWNWIFNMIPIIIAFCSSCINLYLFVGNFTCWFQYGFYLKKETKKKFFSQLSDSDTDFLNKKTILKPKLRKELTLMIELFIYM